jgi:very-short-patch-repair endonuclease
MKYYEVKRFSRKLRNNATPSERVLWERIKDRKMEGFKFLRQHPILYDRQGNNLRFFIPDFYCPAASLIVELDGAVHEFSKEYDQWREDLLRAKGYRLLRFKNDELHDLESVLQRIRVELLGECPPPPFWKGGGPGGG